MESPFTEMKETVGGTDFGGMEGNQEFGFRLAKLEVFIRKPRKDRSGPPAHHFLGHPVGKTEPKRQEARTTQVLRKLSEGLWISTGHSLGDGVQRWS